MRTRRTRKERVGQEGSPPVRKRDPTVDSAPEGQFFQPHLRWLVLALLFVTALGIRLHRITEPPTAFHATRQYRSALLARAYYYDTVDSLPEWKKRNAGIWKDRLGVLEPPILELVAATAYRLTGGEHLWIPRALSVAFWLAGGVFLFLLVMRMACADAAVFSCAFYLFLPYGVSASRSFQPDPLMIMMFLGAVLLLVRYFDASTPTALGRAVTVAALAILVKPVCVFPILGAFVSIGFAKHGLRRFLCRRDVYLFVAGSVLPTALYYAYGLLVSGALESQIRGSVLPRLWVEPAFWSNWLRLVQFVIGYTALCGGLMGIALCRDGTPRALAFGLWGGYVVLGLVFTYHIASHDYYSLPLVPIAAVSLGPIGASILHRLHATCRRWYSRAAVLGVFVLTLFLWMHRAPWRTHESDAETRVRIAQEIGEMVNHSDRAIFLAPDYGKPLAYHAEIAGVNWPSTEELKAQRLRGRPTLTVEERLKRIRQQFSPEYFIVTDRKQFLTQRNLRNSLIDRFPMLAQFEDCVIFDLREQASDILP